MVVSALSCWGSRCCTSTNPMPVSVGRLASRALNASSPPADAPTPTMGKESVTPVLPGVSTDRRAAGGGGVTAVAGRLDFAALPRATRHCGQSEVEFGHFADAILGGTECRLTRPARQLRLYTSNPAYLSVE